MARGRKPKTIIFCEVCGKEITGHTTNGHGNQRKYCSKECWLASLGDRRKIYKKTYCEWCGKEFQETRDRPNKYCSNKCSGRATAMLRMASKADAIRLNLETKERKEEQAKEYHELMERAMDVLTRIVYEKKCEECGAWFMARQTTSVCCSSECAKKRNNRRKEKRIYKNGTPDLSISLTKLYMRDMGICKLCGKMLNFDGDINDDDYPSIDHIIPLAKGGKHEWDNVQLACRRCNTLKGARIIPPTN